MATPSMAAMLNIQFLQSISMYMLPVIPIVLASVDCLPGEMLNGNLTMLPLFDHCSPCHVCL